MDLSAASRDIGDLVSSFAQQDSTSFYQLKELWKSRGFSFIHEACPKDTTQAFFMQSLYSSALGHVKNAEASFSHRLGALFVLYCLYETQYIEPYYLIYLSLEDLENLHFLVKELRRIEHGGGSALGGGSWSLGYRVKHIKFRVSFSFASETGSCQILALHGVN